MNMKDKRPIDKVRDSGGMFTLPPGVGGIQEMCEIQGSLHMLGTNAIYRVKLADEIDPERTNINLPNTHQLVLPYGTELHYVRQTLMQARRLLKDKVLGPDFNYQSGIDLRWTPLVGQESDGLKVESRRLSFPGYAASWSIS